jgi:predicted enzyme related to lactoylglutathione lyase
MLKRVDRVLLRVPQLESAVKYYRDVLGLTQSPKKSATVASFKLGEEQGTELVLHADPDLPAEATYFLVDDVRDLYNRRAELQLKFAAPPAPVTRGFRATVKDPFGNVLLLLDRTADRASGGGGTGTDGTRGGDATIEDAKPAGSGALFAGVEPKIAAKKNVLATIYQNIARTADDLPYTPHFESLYASYTRQLGEPKPTRQEVWRHLLNMRKAGDLPKLGPAKSKPPKLDKSEESRLRDLLGDAIGKRDRLPYTPRFDQLVTDFNRPLTKKLSPHVVWRIVAKLAK